MYWFYFGQLVIMYIYMYFLFSVYIFFYFYSIGGVYYYVVN